MFTLHMHTNETEILVGLYDTYRQAIKAQAEFGPGIYHIEELGNDSINKKAGK